jgi:MFS family permease
MPVHRTVRTSLPTATEAAPVGWSFIVLYALAFISTSLLFIAPLLVTLALKLNALVGEDRAPGRLSLVASVGAFVAMVANPAFGKLSDRTVSRFGMRRPWMIIGLVGGTAGIILVAVAQSVLAVLVGWSIAQLCFNALLAALVAVLPDQVPPRQRGRVAGVLGICTPIASVTGTYVVKLFSPHQLAMFLAPCLIGGAFIVLFVVRLEDRRLSPDDRPAWSGREIISTFYIDPRRCPDFAWAFASRFLFVMAYAFLVTYQAYYLLHRVGTPEGELADRVFQATLVQSAVVVAMSVVGGSLSDRTGRRKVFVLTASAVYGTALFLIAIASSFDGFLVGMAIGGLGFGTYVAVDLALAADVLPDKAEAAKDLGVFNIAGALPFSLAPAIAPAILAIAGGSYSVLYAVAGLCAVFGAAAVLPIKNVR